MNHTGPCPGCGRMVDIPEGMDACFCTFCGARVTRPAPEATAAPAKVSGEEAAAIAGELSETRNRLAAERQAFTRRMDRVAEDASRHCAGLPAGWVRLYNEALGLAPAAPEASAPAAGIGAPAGSASATSAGVRSGASVMVSPEDLLAHARDYGGYCRNLRAQAEALLAVEKGREGRP